MRMIVPNLERLRTAVFGGAPGRTPHAGVGDAAR